MHIEYLHYNSDLDFIIYYRYQTQMILETSKLNGDLFHIQQMYQCFMANCITLGELKE